MCQAGDPRTPWCPTKFMALGHRHTVKMQRQATSGRRACLLPKVVCFGLFDRTLARCGLFSFVFTREYTVRRSEMLLVFLGPVVFGFVRSWLLCRQWLRLVEVFAVVPLGVSCSLSCRVGRYCVACQNVGARAGSFIEVLSSRHSATSGRRVIRARLVFWRSGASGVGASAVHKKSTFFWCCQNKRAPL